MLSKYNNEEAQKMLTRGCKNNFLLANKVRSNI